MYKETWCLPDLVAKLEPYDFLLCDYSDCLIVDGFESRENTYALRSALETMWEWIMFHISAGGSNRPCFEGDGAAVMLKASWT